MRWTDPIFTLLFVLCVYVCICVRVRACACMHACVRARARVCLLLCVCMYVCWTEITQLLLLPGGTAANLVI